MVTAKSVAGSCGAATCCTSSWVSKFGESTTGSCVAAAKSVTGYYVAATFSERNDVTKS